MIGDKSMGSTRGHGWDADVEVVGKVYLGSMELVRGWEEEACHVALTEV